jgi:hypothetical protein
MTGKMERPGSWNDREDRTTEKMERSGRWNDQKAGKTRTTGMTGMFAAQIYLWNLANCTNCIRKDNMQHQKLDFANFFAATKHWFMMLAAQHQSIGAL